MATPLTDSINALTTYANEVTGQSDTTLSDAVHTLASGYNGGGSSYTRTVVCPLQNFTLPSDNNYVALTDAQRLIAMSNYIITYDSIEYICTAGELWGSDRLLGDLVLTWGNTTSDYIFPFCVEDWNGNPRPIVYARDKNQHSIQIELLELS